MPITGRSLFAVLSIVLLSACATGETEIRMVDPRTGVVAICRQSQSEAAVPTSILAAVTQANPCLDELSYYGFQDEAPLLAAARPR